MLLKVITVNNTWFVTKHGFKFQDSVCDGCHDLMMLSFNISNITIIAFTGVDYCCITKCIYGITKSEPIH